MTARVILNPYSNRWNALARKEEAKLALKTAGIDFEIFVTEKPGHATELAAEAVKLGRSPVIAAGGDGTISEVVNGLVTAAEKLGLDLSEVPLGILPLGSANDLVDNLKMPKDLNAMASVIAAGKTTAIDLLTVNGRLFDNNSAIGLEPYITLIQQRITRLKGVPRYLVATMLGIRDNPQWKMHLEWEGGQYSGPVTLVTVGNCPRTGGVFYTTPHADPTDHLLTFVYGYLPTRGKIFELLPKTMKPGEGSYVEHPAIHEIHSPWLKVYSENPTPMHADGEIQDEAIQTLEYSVYPKMLYVLAP